MYDGDLLLDVRVKWRVGFKKPGDAEPKDFVSVDLAENVGTIVNAFGANFVDIDVLGEEPQEKAAKPLNSFNVLMKAAATRTLPPEIGTEEQTNPTQWVELHNRLLRNVKIMYPGAGFPHAEVKLQVRFLRMMFCPLFKYIQWKHRSGSTEPDWCTSQWADEAPIQSG